VSLSTADAGAQTLSRGYENRLLVILTLGGAVAALDAQTLFYLSPFVASSLGLNNAQIGVLSSIVLVSWSISGYVTGKLSDRSGRRKPWLVATFVLFAGCSFFSGLATSFAMLFAARVLIGLAEGPVIPVSQSIMIRNSSPHRRGFNMGVVQNFGAQLIGTLVGPILIVKVATDFGWHAAFYVAGVPALIVALLVALFIDEPRPQKPGFNASQTAAAGLGLRQLLRVHNVRLCVVVACCVCAWYFILLTFLPLYCVRVLGISPTDMSYVMSAIGAAGVVSALVVPALSDRFGRKRIMTVFTLASLVAPLAPIYAGSSLYALIGFVFVGCLVLGTVPLFMATVPLESVPARDAAAATGLVMGLGQIVGGFSGPAIGGILADRWGLSVPLWIAAAVVVLGTLACMRLRETAPRALGYAVQDS
jgi:MFS family permease